MLDRLWDRVAGATVGVRALALATAFAWAVFEIAWRRGHGWSSPAMGLAYPLVAWLAGAAALGARARTPHAVRFAAGAVVIAVSFGGLSAVGLAGGTPILVGAAAAAGAARLGAAGFARARVPLTTVAAALGVVALAARAVWFADRLPVFGPHPTTFPWIDTPLWLDLAYGAERGVPVPDVLFDGGRVNYHFGAFVLVAAVRRLTGVPMHVAYFVTATSAVCATSALAASVLRAFFGVRAGRGAGALLAATATFVWLELFTQNASTTIALPITLAVPIVLARGRRVGELAPVALAIAALAVTKEVQLVSAALLGGAVGVGRALRRRFIPLGAVVAGGLVGKAAQVALLRPDQRVSLALNHENLTGEIATQVLKDAAPFLVVGLGAAIVAARFRARLPGYAGALAAASVCYLVGLGIWLVLLPVVTPRLDPFSYQWLRIDVFQFVHFGRQVTLGALALAAIGVWSRLAMPRAGRGLAAGLVVVATFGAIFSVWRAPPPGPDDPVVPLLARVDPKTSLVAADRLNPNAENPHWAAYFGHRFFVLRTGRWTPAYGHFERASADQRVLFTTDDEAAALAIVRARGVTHVIEDRARPVPWLARRAPLAETPELRLHAVGP